MDKFYYFFQMDFQDKNGKNFYNYDMWISDYLQNNEFVDFDKLHLMLKNE